MEKIEVYKLSDGTLFEGSEKDAEKIQKELTFKDEVNVFANKYGSYGEYCDEIYTSIMENSDELYEILKRYKD